jgi:hypothetical protein
MSQEPQKNNLDNLSKPYYKNIFKKKSSQSLLESPTIKHLSPNTLAYNTKNLCYAPPTIPYKVKKDIHKFRYELKLE